MNELQWTETDEPEPEEMQSNFISCIFCKKEIDGKTALVRHVNSVHRANEKFDCKLCTIYFRSRAEAVKHRDEVHNDEVAPKCTHCGEGFFRNKRQLQYHITKVHGNVVKCNLSKSCYNFFRTKEEKKKARSHCALELDE